MSHSLRQLIAGQALTGTFWPAGTELPSGGVLRWTFEEGAVLDLVGETEAWAGDTGERLTVHGVPSDTSGIRFTLPGCMVRSVAATGRVRRVSCDVLAEGAHFTEATRWSSARYRPRNLHEWWPETGIRMQDHEDGQARAVEWERPPPVKVDLPGAEVSLTWGISAPWSESPDFTLSSTLATRIEPVEPATIGDLLREWGTPIVAFSAFAADRPESLLEETLSSAERRELVTVLRRGRHLEPPEWRFGGTYLFTAADLDDVPAALSTWLGLWSRTQPALGLLSDAIDEGNLYGPGRFLSLYTAAEGYYRATRRPHEKPWKIDRLADRAGVRAELTGCTKDALALIGVTREYHSHLGTPARWTSDEIEEETFYSTRRLHALLQAALLRELGMSTAKIEAPEEALPQLASAELRWR